MAKRAYIVLRRNDLGKNFLQALDLKPNTSQRSFPYEPPGQTAYLSHYLYDGVNNDVTTVGAGPITVAADTYGLSGYLIDRVEGLGAPGSRSSLTFLQVEAAVKAIAADAGNGNPLTLTDLDADIAGSMSVSNTMAAANTLNAADNQADDYYTDWTVEIIGGAGIGQKRTVTGYVHATDVITPDVAFSPATDGTSVYLLNPPVGLETGNSIGSVEDVLRILSGERWKIEAGSQVETVTGHFDDTARGYFVTAPNRVQPITSGPGGRKSTDRVFPDALPVQTGTQDVNFVPLRHIYNTGDLHRSALLGALAKVKDSNFTFVNSSFTYGTGGTALLLDAVTSIGTNGQAAAVQVYAADGTVI